MSFKLPRQALRHTQRPPPNLRIRIFRHRFNASCPFVENVMEKGSLHNIYFIAAVDTKDISFMRGSRAYEAMISYHTGIQLGGNAMEAAYFDFSHLTYTEQNKGYKAGIGMIPRDNDESGVEKVIIPQYRKRDV